MKQPPGKRGWTNRSLGLERDSHRTRWIWILLLGLILAASPTAFYVLQQSECVKLSYEVNELRTEGEQLLEQERRLRFQRARLESLVSIEAWAVERHGLEHLAPQQVVVVRRAPGV